MGRACISLIILGIIFISPFCYSQSSIRVSDPILEIDGKTIHISYDILNSTPSQEFTVELIVRDDKGELINPVALSGDVGNKVNGGNGKYIGWDLAADRLEIDADLFIKVSVKEIPPPEPIVLIPPVQRNVQKETADQPQADESREETTEDRDIQKETAEQPLTDKPSEKTMEDGDIQKETAEQPLADKSNEETVEDDVKTSLPESSVAMQFNRRSLIIQSVAFPGLGLSRYKGGPHWIKGILGYSCIAGSIIMYQVANHTEDEISYRETYDLGYTLYQKYHNQRQASFILAYSTIPIWISDVVWTFLGTSDLNKTTFYQKGFRINPAIDPYSGAPLLAFTFQF